jgi:hypothetical protein
MKAFYGMLKETLCQKDSTSVLLSKDDYNRRVKFGLYLINGGDCRTSAIVGNTTTNEWARKYHVVTAGQESAALVLRPYKKIGAIDMTAMRLENLQQPTYIERVFSDLMKIHQVDHCKGNSLYGRARDHHGNITRELCKMFTDLSPHWVKLLSRRKPVAGVKNIVTNGFGILGQADIIDFQSMPDGVFKYLLNYVDHGVKKLTSISLANKQACVLLLLYSQYLLSRGLQLFFRPTTEGNFQDTPTIMWGVKCSLMMSSLTSS